MRDLHVYYTASLVIPDGSDTNGYGEGCEPGHRYTIADGWLDPDWTRTEVYADQEEVRPDRWTRGDRSPVAWLAERLAERIGGVESGSGPDSLYAIDSDQDYRTGIESRRAAHPKGFTEEEITYAVRIVNGK